MSTIKAIFSDINGVLFQQEIRPSLRYSQKFAVPIEILNEFLGADLDLCLTGKDDLKTRLAGLITDWRWHGSADELLEYWTGKEMPPQDEFIKCLNHFREKGILLFLATQNEKYKTTRYLNLLQPLLQYDYLIATYIVGYKKSDPQYFKTCLEKYSLQPAEVVLIDNNPAAIATAKSVGIKTILFENEAQSTSELKKYM